jgi:hypothetical protein
LALQTAKTKVDESDALMQSILSVVPARVRLEEIKYSGSGHYR